MAPRVKVLAANTDDLSSVPALTLVLGTRRVEGEKRLP